MNSAKLYVGNLPYSTTDKQLADLFSQAGQVKEAVIIFNKYTKRSKGFGFVEMTTRDEAENAQKMFNGKEFEGRKIIVNEARPQEQKKSHSEKPIHKEDKVN